MEAGLVDPLTQHSHPLFTGLRVLGIETAPFLLVVEESNPSHRRSVGLCDIQVKRLELEVETERQRECRCSLGGSGEKQSILK